MDTKARVDAVLSEAPYKPLHESVVRISLWDGRPLPLRRWAIENCVPAFQICGFFGEGGSGKSILEMMKDAAHVLGSNWLSLVPVPGPAIFLSSEDHIDELQVRLSRVADHYGVGLTQLEDRGFHLISRYGEDTLLCEATRSGRIMPTKLYTELREMIGDIKPKNVSLELSRIYAGSEIDRVSVNQLAEHLQALALLTDAGSVTLLGHPSLTGIASGTGSSGTTGWHGSFRARCYLRTPKQREDEEQDSSVRELVFLKNQYGALPATIQLRFRDGLWLPDEGETEEDREQRQAKVRDVFLGMLKQSIDLGDNVSHLRSAKNYAPRWFAKAAREQGIRPTDLEDAMNTLMSAGKIKPQTASEAGASMMRASPLASAFHGRASPCRTHRSPIERWKCESMEALTFLLPSSIGASSRVPGLAHA